MTFSHSLKIDAPEEVWRRWLDVQTWHEWDTEVKEASLEGDFELGAKGTLTPKTGPEASFAITEFTPQQSYTFTAALPLAKLHVRRYFSEDIALPKYTETECRRQHLTTCVLDTVSHSESVSNQMIPANRTTFTHEVSFTGPLSSIFGFLLGRRFQKVLPEVMANLRELAESPKGVTAS